MLHHVDRARTLHGSAKGRQENTSCCARPPTLAVSALYTESYQMGEFSESKEKGCHDGLCSPWVGPSTASTPSPPLRLERSMVTIAASKFSGSSLYRLDDISGIRFLRRRTGGRAQYVIFGHKSSLIERIFWNGPLREEPRLTR